ncbi:MAG: hypothetical protein A2340_11255 [Lentisphaerae bacterium RIFOXYB12_FULL_60_10]|nr:MAG: hypothetical protein A2340_11255 [Lentisphaerae bacterium RIFOXYB12_FULL_60_10]
MSAVREISLNDDAFMARTLEEVEDFAHQYRIRVNLPLRIYGLVSGLFNIHKVAALVDAGLYFVRMGIQTGSPKMRRIYGRRQTDNEVVEAAHVLHSFHHKLSHICYDIIIDSPWDSARDLDKTIMLLSRLPLPYSLNVFSLIMYPGTVLREMAIKEGILAGDRLKQAYWDSTILPSSRSFVRRIFSSIGCRTCREKPVPWLMYRVCLFFYMVGVVGFAEVRSFLNIMKVWLIRRFAPRPNMEPMFGWQLNHAETDKRLLTRIRRFILMHANVSLSIPWHCETTVSIGCNTQMGKCLYLTGTYEPNEFAWLNEVLATGMVVLDAGANVGLYTVFMAKKVGSGGKVIAVEPSKREMCYLKENCRRNNLENVLLRQVALAANTGHAELCVAPDEYNGLNSIGRFRYPDIPVAAREMVKTMTIDDLVEECGLSRLDFIKLDVEGSEYEVLRGAYRTIQQHHPAIMIEYERSRPGTRLLDPEFEKLLLQYSYRYQPLTSIGAVEQKGFVNLVGTIIAFHPLGTVRIKQ